MSLQKLASSELVSNLVGCAGYADVESVQKVLCRLELGPPVFLELVRNSFRVASRVPTFQNDAVRRRNAKRRRRRRGVRRWKAGRQ